MSPSDEERVNQYLRSTIDGILQEWDGWRAKEQPFYPANWDTDPYATKRYMLVYGMACQAHESAKGYLAVLDEVPVAATPMARSCFELGMTAHWAAQVPDAWAALANKNLCSNKKLANELVRADNSENREYGEQIKARIATNNFQELPTNSGGPAGSFQQLCADLEGAKDFYLAYRAQSAETHAGAASGDPWFVPSEDGTQMRMQLSPTLLHQGWLHIVACSLIWAESAVDHLDRDRERKAHLDEVAKSIKCPVSFNPTKKAINRVQRADKKNK